MLPGLVDIGGPWKVLPPGVHDATLSEVRRRFATNTRRRQLFDGFRRAWSCLQASGCRSIYLDGSYVSDKPYPGDFDACWDPAGVDESTLDPVLLDFSDGRKHQKLRYGGELFPSSPRSDGSIPFVKFFGTDRSTGAQKGVVRVRVS